MKPIAFYKMSAAGNDFVIIDAVKVDLVKLAVAVCNRKTGIGADGLLVLERSHKADFRMRIINADGSEAEMCGNGVRCLATYVVLTKNVKKKNFTIESLAGIIQNEVTGTVASARLSDPKNFKEDMIISVNERELRVNHIDTGVPHTIIFVSGIDEIDVENLGPVIRYHRQFAPRGTNVDFVEQVDRGLIKVRTYERGVEGETLACGTGSVASAIVAYLKANPSVKTKERIKMKAQTSGGEILEVQFDLNAKKITNVWLKGAVKLIAKGEYYV